MTIDSATAFPAAIPAAIAKIMAAVGSVEKRGKNQFHNYAYATAADILHKLQPLMAEHGLVVMQTEASKDFIRDGSVMVVEYDFQLVHSSGVVWPERTRQTGITGCLNTKGGFDDKAANKCHTAARKYFLLALFQIPTGEYADADGEEDRGPERQPSRANGQVRRAEPAPLPPGPPPREMTFDPPGAVARNAAAPPPMAVALQANERGGVAWARWFEDFGQMVDGCDTADELAMLVKDNTMTLGQLKEKPKDGDAAYGKLMALVDARRNKLLDDAAKPDGLAA